MVHVDGEHHLHYAGRDTPVVACIVRSTPLRAAQTENVACAFVSDCKVNDANTRVLPLIHSTLACSESRQQDTCDKFYFGHF